MRSKTVVEILLEKEVNRLSSLLAQYKYSNELCAETLEITPFLTDREKRLAEIVTIHLKDPVSYGATYGGGPFLLDSKSK